MAELDLLEKSRLFFESLEKNKEKSDKLHMLFIQIIDKFLASPNDELLTIIFDLFDKNRDDAAFYLKSDLVRLDRIFNIIRKETKEGLVPFYSGCINVKELIDKYILTLFAIYRIETQVNSDFAKEGLEYLLNNNTSNAALNLICDEEMVVFKSKVLDAVAGGIQDE